MEINQLYRTLLQALPKQTNNEIDKELSKWLANEVA